MTDPDFEIPSEWKFSLGLTYLTEDDYTITADILHTQKQDSAIIKDLALTQVATAPDGRPVYNSTNHPFNSDFLLTNVKGNDGENTILSASVSKSFDNGFRFTASYAFTEAKDVHPMTSSVAFSNYHNIAVYDSENPQLSRSNYEIPHRFTLSLKYTTQLLDGYDTKFTLFGQANEGSPYDYTFTSRTSGLGFNDADRQLLYIPLLNDPNVIYANPGVETALNNFIANEGLEQYRGRIMPRNSLDSDWWVKFDVKVEQEFPGFAEGHKFSAFMVVENLGNLLNEDWGIQKNGSRLQGAIEAEVTDDNKYLYERFTNPTDQSRSDVASQWEMRFGIKYEF